MKRKLMKSSIGAMMFIFMIYVLPTGWGHLLANEHTNPGLIEGIDTNNIAFIQLYSSNDVESRISNTSTKDTLTIENLKDVQDVLYSDGARILIKEKATDIVETYEYQGSTNAFVKLEDMEVRIPDENLKKALNKILGQVEESAISKLQMEMFKGTHTFEGLGIKNLSGIEYAVHALGLVFTKNEISDGTPLKQLRMLERLELNENPIHDITPIKALSTLTYLNLADTKVNNDLDFSSMTKLAELYLDRNEISDLTSLKYGERMRNVRIRSQKIKGTEAFAEERITKVDNIIKKEDGSFVPPEVSDVVTYAKENHQVIFKTSNERSVSYQFRELKRINREGELDFSGTVTNNVADTRVIIGIPDENLRKALNEKLGKGTNVTTEITQAELNRINGDLNLANKNITDPEGLQYVFYIKRLYIQNNNLKSIGSIMYMTYLTTLHIFNNPILNLEGMQRLTNLEELWAYTLGTPGARLSDISQLRYLTALKRLDIGDNNIRNVDVLSTLTGLEVLRLNQNEITDLSALKTLVHVKSGNWNGQRVRGNEVTSVGTRAMIENMVKRIDGTLIPPVTSSAYEYVEPTIIFPNITTNDYAYTFQEDITIGSLTSPFTGTVTHRVIYADTIVNIPDLNLRRALNQKLGKGANATTEIYFSELESLTGYLALSSKGIADVEGLQYAINIDSLAIDTNNLFELGVIADMKFLRKLWISRNPMTNLETIQKLTNLEYLSAIGLGRAGSKLKDVKPISKLTNLQELYIHENEIADLSPLHTLVNLTKGKLTNQSITGTNVASFGPNAVVENVIKRVDNTLVPPVASSAYRYTGFKIIFNNITATNDYAYTFSENVTIGSLTTEFSGTVTHWIRYGDEIVNMPDLNLRKEINKLLGKGNNVTTEIYQSEMVSLKDHIPLGEKGIVNAEGMQYAINVVGVVIGNNNLTELGALADMPSLLELWIFKNPMTNLEGIEKLKTLEYLSAYRLGTGASTLKDVSPLAGLTNLKQLFLQENGIADLSPLKNLNLVTGLFRDQRIRGADVPTFSPNPLVENIVKRLDGTLIAPTGSSAYGYAEPKITFKSLNATNEYAYSFHENVTVGGLTTAFSGTVTQHITNANLLGYVSIPKRIELINGENGSDRYIAANADVYVTQSIGLFEYTVRVDQQFDLKNTKNPSHVVKVNTSAAGVEGNKVVLGNLTKDNTKDNPLEVAFKAGRDGVDKASGRWDGVVKFYFELNP